VATPDDDLPPDATPPDELGAARPLLAAGLALGPALLAAGDARGAHEVYDCAARLALATLPAATPLRAAAVAALEAAEFEPDPAARAATLQGFFFAALGEPALDPADEFAASPEDPDEGGPLDQAHGVLGKAIALGAPAFNLGNHRGCCEVYAAAARLVLAGAPPDPVRDRLGRALTEATPVADERKKAWVLRDAFNDVLAMSVGRAGPRISPRDVRVLISMAVQIGAPAYNLGDHRGCYEVYATTARLILQVAQDAGREREVIRAALQTAAVIADATEQAWVLRRAFDAILNSEA